MRSPLNSHGLPPPAAARFYIYYNYHYHIHGKFTLSNYHNYNYSIRSSSCCELARCPAGLAALPCWACPRHRCVSPMNTRSCPRSCVESSRTQGGVAQLRASVVDGDVIMRETARRRRSSQNCHWLQKVTKDMQRRLSVTESGLWRATALKHCVRATRQVRGTNRKQVQHQQLAASTSCQRMRNTSCSWRLEL